MNFGSIKRRKKNESLKEYMNIISERTNRRSSPPKKKRFYRKVNSKNKKKSPF